MFSMKELHSHSFAPIKTIDHLLSQAPSVGSGEASLPGVVEQMQPQFISRFLEGQSGVTIKSVSCGDLFTTCMTGRWAVPLYITNQNHHIHAQSA